MVERNEHTKYHQQRLKRVNPETWQRLTKTLLATFPDLPLSHKCKIDQENAKLHFFVTQALEFVGRAMAQRLPLEAVSFHPGDPRSGQIQSYGEWMSTWQSDFSKPVVCTWFRVDGSGGLRLTRASVGLIRDVLEHQEMYPELVHCFR